MVSACLAVQERHQPVAVRQLALAATDSHGQPVDAHVLVITNT